MSGDFRPTASWEMLELRARLLRSVRRFFDESGFLEIETPLLSADTVIDLHLDPVPVRVADDPKSPNVGRPMWLQTSPEFCMKRLLASSPRPTYQIAKAFRLAESGPMHNPEFTIIEWYEPQADDQAGRSLLDKFCQRVLECAPAEELTYKAAFQTSLGINPHAASETELAALAAQTPQLSGLNGLDKDGWLDVLFTHCVQPQLGQGCPTIIYEYPASQAALAKTRINDQGEEVAARFELFTRGIELANGYDELLDAGLLRKRMRATNAMRAAAGKPKLPEDNRLLSAMESGLPQCSGCALGFDRLVMVAAGAKSINEVLPFPIDRA